MKIFFILIISLILCSFAYFIYLSVRSHSGIPPGLSNNKLSSCPNSPNCINSEFNKDTLHFIDSLPYQNKTIAEVTLLIRHAIQKTGGHITDINSNYIAATYTSKLFRYVDDLEIRIDSEQKVMHFRSASRVGRSDFGVNIKRIQLIQKELETQLR